MFLFWSCGCHFLCFPEWFFFLCPQLYKPVGWWCLSLKHWGTSEQDERDLSPLRSHGWEGQASALAWPGWRLFPAQDTTQTLLRAGTLPLGVLREKEPRKRPVGCCWEQSRSTLVSGGADPGQLVLPYYASHSLLGSWQWEHLQHWWGNAMGEQA